MANLTIEQLPTVATLADADKIPIWDASAGTTGENTLAVLAAYVNNLGLRQVSGSWTPQLQFGAANVGMTMSSQGGRYVRIGSLVWVEGRIVLTAKGSSTGVAKIAGLPWSASASFIHPASCWWMTMATALAHMTGLMVGTAIDLYGATGAVNSLTALTHAEFGMTSQLRCGGLYYTTDAFP